MRGPELPIDLGNPPSCSRRQMIAGIGIAAAAVPLAGGTAFAAKRSAGFSIGLYDNRYAEARRFGQTLLLSGVRTIGFDGDLTGIWQDELHPRWRVQPALLTGLTSHRSLICLEGFARDYGMRLIYSGMHSADNADMVAHTLRGPAPLIARNLAEADGASWGSRAADMVMRYRESPGDTASVVLRSKAARAGGGTLFSWIIAPARRT
ncbi:hypothetical protein BH09PSE4_BH09PSE4_08670 [soil metagenome]